jgi:hypothetical protein
MASFSGIVPPVKPSKMEPIPEDKLIIGNKYLIETNSSENGRNKRRRYRGILHKLKDDKNCYTFKYLETFGPYNIETVNDMIYNGDDGEVFVKIYNAPTDGHMLTLEELKTMQETRQVVAGQTYYVRYVGADEITDLDFMGAFRGKYVGGPGDLAVGAVYEDDVLDDHTFSNVIKINNSKIYSEICLNDKTINFYHTAEARNEHDRTRRAIESIIPYGDPYRLVGGSTKRKISKRKISKRKISKRKSSKRNKK